MKSNITPIRGQELVSILEDWLEQARLGKVKAIAFAAIMEDGHISEGWTGAIEDHALTLYAAINILRDAYFHDNIDHYSKANISE